jgi:hypothetical protein
LAGVAASLCGGVAMGLSSALSSFLGIALSGHDLKDMIDKSHYSRNNFSHTSK